jgi:hypothetical protein
MQAPVLMRTSARRKASPPHKHSTTRPHKDKGVRMDTSKGEIVFYKTSDRSTAIEVRLEQDTVWLTQSQMVDLFQRNQSVIARHLRNIFTSKELDEKSNMQKMHIAFSDKLVAFYSLDVIISVGYRVNSRRGTQFRIWATRVLKDHLVRGYTANERRLKELRQSLKLVQNVVERLDISGDEARALLATVADYAYALDLLDDYDHQRVVPSSVEVKPSRGIAYEEALDVVQRLRAKFGGSDLFGRERDDSLKGSLAAILQTFGGKDLLSQHRGEGCPPPVFPREEPFVCGRKQANRCFPVLVVHAEERSTVPSRRCEADSGQRPGRTDHHGRGERSRGEGHHRQPRHQSYK